MSQKSVKYDLDSKGRFTNSTRHKLKGQIALQREILSRAASRKEKKASHRKDKKAARRVARDDDGEAQAVVEV